MTVVVDITVLLDVFLRRQPHYAASAAITSAVLNGELKGICPAQALTTLYYLAKKHGSQSDAETAVDEVLRDFEIVSLEKSRLAPRPSADHAGLRGRGGCRNRRQCRRSLQHHPQRSRFRPVSGPGNQPGSFLIRFMTKL